MKRKSNYQKAKEKAIKMLCNRANVALKKYLSIGYFRKQLDFRRNFDKDVYYYISTLSKEIDFNEVAKKQKQRAQNKYIEPQKNYLNNPLFIDYIRHNNDILFIGENVIRFKNGRNHWVKNEKDIKVLSILKKHFLCRK